MIQPKELRQGNIIGWRTGFGELITGPVHEVHADKVAIGPETFIDSNRSGQSFMKVEGIEPILITAEWLERCGFEYMEPYYSKGILKLFMNTIRDGSGDYDGFGVMIHVENIKIPLVLRHMHRLQNLYLDLFGEELKLKAL